MKPLRTGVSPTIAGRLLIVASALASGGGDVWGAEAYRQPAPFDARALPLIQDTGPTGSSHSVNQDDVQAAITGFACVVNGQSVSIEDAPDLDNLSIATRETDPDGRVQFFITVNLKALKTLALPTRLFWLEHECGHHALGHTRANALPPPSQLGRDEVAADCWGVRKMASKINNDGGELETAIRDMNRIPGGEGYPTGAVRAACLKTCLVHADQGPEQVASTCY